MSLEPMSGEPDAHVLHVPFRRGATVVGADGASLGTVEQIVVDREQGALRALVVRDAATGREVEVPATQLVHADDQQVELKITRADLSGHSGVARTYNPGDYVAVDEQNAVSPDQAIRLAASTHQPVVAEIEADSADVVLPEELATDDTPTRKQPVPKIQSLPPIEPAEPAPPSGVLATPPPMPLPEVATADATPATPPAEEAAPMQEEPALPVEETTTSAALVLPVEVMDSATEAPPMPATPPAAPTGAATVTTTKPVQPSAPPVVPVQTPAVGGQERGRMRPLLLGALLVVAGTATFIAFRRRRMSRTERVKLMAAQVAAQATRPVRQARSQYRWFQRGMRVGRSVEAVGHEARREPSTTLEGASAKLAQVATSATATATDRRAALTAFARRMRFGRNTRRADREREAQQGGPDYTTHAELADRAGSPDVVVELQPTAG